MSMGTNMYGSDITKLRKARALSAFKKANTAAVQAGLSVLPEQGPPPLDSERISRVVGGTNIVVPYPLASSATQSHVIPGCANCPAETVPAIVVQIQR